MSDEKGYRGFQIYRTANPTPVRNWDYAAHLWDDPESGIEFMGASVDAVKRNIDFELDDSPPEIFIQRGNQTWFSAKGYHDTVETSEAELTKYVLDNSPWIDVKALPKDSSDFLVRMKWHRSENTVCFVARYCRPLDMESDNTEDWAVYDEKSDAYYCPEGWYESNVNWDGEYSYVQVTEGDVIEYMPIPPGKE